MVDTGQGGRALSGRGSCEVTGGDGHKYTEKPGIMEGFQRES